MVLKVVKGYMNQDYGGDGGGEGQRRKRRRWKGGREALSVMDQLLKRFEEDIGFILVSTFHLLRKKGVFFSPEKITHHVVCQKPTSALIEPLAHHCRQCSARPPWPVG